MTDDSYSPALSPKDWATSLASRQQLEALRDGLLDTPFSPHGIAALMLYDQPYGFSRQDVIDEEEVAAYCDKMAREHEAAGHAEIAATFRSLGPRHRERAAKIAALLPPTGTGSAETERQIPGDGMSGGAGGSGGGGSPGGGPMVS
jgi:hypothetical protein